MSASKIWASDTQVSRPAPASPDHPVMVSFGGFAFSSGGMTHDLTEVDAETIFIPTFGPNQ